VRFSGIGRLVATPSRPSLALCPFGTLGPSRALSSPFIAPLQLNGSLLDIGSYPPAPTLYIRHFPVHRYARDKGLADCRSSAARIEPFSLSLRFGRTWPPLEKSPRERMQRRIIVQCAVRYGIHRRASLDLPRRTVIRITYSRRAVRYPSFSLSDPSLLAFLELFRVDAREPTPRSSHSFPLFVHDGTSKLWAYGYKRLVLTAGVFSPIFD
jgi:hypothetical protein